MTKLKCAMLPQLPKDLRGLVQTAALKRSGVVGPEVGAAPASGGVVVDHGAHDDGVAEPRDDHRGVPVLPH
jgi:hypothetical protein